MQRVVRKALRAVMNYDPGYYDMYEDANEAFFGALYVERIAAEAERLGIRPPATLLEAGCQAGRLLVPFARLGFEVTGLDRSGFALRRARRHAAEAGVRARFIHGDLLKVLAGPVPFRYDIVVCAEVLYLLAHPWDALRRLAGALRPGGLLCVSHRPKLYYLLDAARRGRLDAAEFVFGRQEGPLSYFDTGSFNWQTRGELEAAYRDAGLRWLDCFPVDRFAWLVGLDPSRLDDEGRARLRALEQLTMEETGMLGRYVCVLSQAPEGTA